MPLPYLSSFNSKDGRLYIGEISARELVKKFGTPLYVIDEMRIRSNYRKLANAFHSSRIYYAAKANSNLSILKILLDEGAYIDVLSPGEIFFALRAGFQNSKIMFSGTSVSKEALEYAVNAKVFINVDSVGQMVNLLKMTKPDFVSARVNPGIGSGHHAHVITGGEASKFGLWNDDIQSVYKMAVDAGVKQFGLHMHIGSGVTEVEPYIIALQNLLNIAGNIHDSFGITFELIDIGGGFGVPYKPKEKPIDISYFADRIMKTFHKYVNKKELGEPILCIEPGRYIVCDSTLLLTRVSSIKTTPSRTFIGVDAGFNTLIRPAMYHAYHHIIAADKLKEPFVGKYDIAGPLCESGDLLGINRSLPKVDEGDLLAVLDTGAYGYCMSSQYNGQPRPAEVLVKNGKYELVRERESFEDLLDNQVMASWLK
jgi:diaminopimelate decarboxylase